MRRVLAVLLMLAVAVAAGCSTTKGGSPAERSAAQAEAEWLVLTMVDAMRWDWQFKLADKLRFSPYSYVQQRMLTKASMKPFDKGRASAELADVYAERFTAPQLSLLRQIYSSGGMTVAATGVIPERARSSSMAAALRAAGLTDADINEATSIFMQYWDERVDEALKEIQAAEQSIVSGY